MSGTFNPSALPSLPGVFTRYRAAVEAALPPSPGGIVALPIVHTWGPSNVPVLLTSFAMFEELFGTDASPGRTAVFGAFKGEGLEGSGGASAVYVDRMTSNAGVKAGVSLKNPGAQNAIAISARFEGTRGNRLSVVVGPIVEGKQHLTVLDGTAELESYAYAIAEAHALEELVEEINAVSPWIEAVLSTEGTSGLGIGTFGLKDGNNGESLATEDWINSASRFNNIDFAYFAPYDLPWEPGESGATVRTLIKALQAWCDAQEESGHRFTLVTGGALDEEPAAAVLRAQELNDPSVITVGGPGLEDDIFGPLSTSQLAPRIAGIRAQRGESQNAHFARLQGTLPRTKTTGAAVTLTEIENMVNAGVVALQRDRYAVAPTRIVKDVNTWAPKPRSTAEAERPRKIWGNPKMIQTMQQFANEAEQLLETTMIGRVTVNKASRQAAAARVLTFSDHRIKSGAFQPGVTVTPVEGSSSDEFIELEVLLPFGRALAQLFLNATVS